jgi:mevalonate kinase
LEKCQDNDFEVKLKNFVELNDQAITCFLESDYNLLNELMYKISKWQYINLSEMIPSDVKELWLEGIEEKNYFMKLCGAGGGGHYFVYSNNDFDIKQKFNSSIHIF